MFKQQMSHHAKEDELVFFAVKTNMWNNGKNKLDL